MTNTATPDWFKRFQGFTYDHATGLKSNFLRLSAARQWGPNRKAAQWVACQSATFDNLYGTDTTKLEIWQDLCREVYIKNPPNSITGCKKVREDTQVHSVCTDMLDYRSLEVAIFS